MEDHSRAGRNSNMSKEMPEDAELAGWPVRVLSDLTLMSIASIRWVFGVSAPSSNGQDGLHFPVRDAFRRGRQIYDLERDILVDAFFASIDIREKADRE